MRQDRRGGAEGRARHRRSGRRHAGRRDRAGWLRRAPGGRRAPTSRRRWPRRRRGRPPQPHLDERWRRIAVDDRRRHISRPPGLRLDIGGIAKGVFADELAGMLEGFDAYAVDCCGDLRVGGRAQVCRPVHVASPFDSSTLHTFPVTDGSVATSGIGRRSWTTDGGRPAHHLLDPRTGAPAFTGIVQATALAPTAAQAEVLAKAAVLSGPARAAEWLTHGGRHRPRRRPARGDRPGRGPVMPPALPPRAAGRPGRRGCRGRRGLAPTTKGGRSQSHRAPLIWHVLQVRRPRFAADVPPVRPARRPTGRRRRPHGVSSGRRRSRPDRCRRRSRRCG